MTDLLLKLFRLDRADFDAAEGWRLQFASDWPAPVVVLAGIALIVLVWQVYGREKGTASPRYKLMLALFRLAAFAVLVFILLQPAIVVATSRLKEAYVVILADKSDSMTLSDKYRDEKLMARLARATGLAPDAEPGKPLDPDVADRLRAMPRAEIVNRVLANPELDLAGRVAENSRLRQHVFAASLSPAPTPEPSDEMKQVFKALAAPRPEGALRPLVIEPDGPATQIGECIRDAVAELRGQRIAAMIVLSDWCSNSGLSPAEATRYALEARSAFPVFAVGVGSAAEQRDIVVASVSANAVAFLNDPLVFNVAIEQAGYDGARVPLELRIGDETVATKAITLQPGRKYYTITHKPDKTGVFTYTAMVPPLEEELSETNNAVEHTVTVKDDKIRVLLIAGGPSWEWRHLRPALVRDKTVTLSAWLQSADQGWVMAGGKQLSQLPLNKRELVDEFDVIILLDASADAFSAEQLDNLRSFVADSGGGLIFIAGSLSAAHAFGGTPLAKCLPVELSPAPGDAGPTGEPFQLAITPEGWAHPGTRLADDPSENRRIWQNLAAFFWFHPVDKIKPGARVLAAHPLLKTPNGRPTPIFVEQRYGAGKVFFSATDETWRWRFLIGDVYFYRFWRQMLALTGSNKLLGLSKRVAISVARTRYTIGSRVEVEARLLDETLRPPGDAPVMTTVDEPGGATRPLTLTLADSAQGVYRGSFVPRKLGSYAVWMRPAPDEPPERAAFSVAMSTLESESRRLNLEAMKAVAKKTSGAWFTIDRVGEIPERIRSEAQNIITERPIPIWDTWGCLILFAIPLTCEWWLRKRRMLT